MARRAALRRGESAVVEATKGGTNHHTTVPIYAEHTRLLNACVSVHLPRTGFSDRLIERLIHSLIVAAHLVFLLVKAKVKR